MRHQLISCALTVCIVSACGGGGKRQNWDDIDYAPVYKAYEKRQNDSGYTAPSVIGCVDDDLYNCK